MKTYNSLKSGFRIDPAYFNNLSPMTGCSTKNRYIIGRLSSRFTLYTRKQKRTSHPPPPPKRPQTAKWLFAAFLFFDNIPRNSLSNSRELWGILSNGCANFRCFYRKISAYGEKGCFVKNLQCGAHDAACGFLHWHEPAGKNNFPQMPPKAALVYTRLSAMIRAPPLLKFGLKFPCQISEESEETILHTRYFRKKDPFCQPEAIEWIEMSGGEYYRFVTDPKNKGRCFIDMGDVVLECTKAEYKQYKAEDDHSSYILEQQEGWSTVSLSILEEQEFASGEKAIVDTNPCIEEVVTQRLLLQEMQKVLRQLSMEDYLLIYELYLANPRKTVRQLSAENHVPVMTLQNRKLRIIGSLKKFLRI